MPQQDPDQNASVSRMPKAHKLTKNLLTHAARNDMGTEDYFGGAWCFGGAPEPTTTDPYSTPFLGYLLYRNEPGEVPQHGLYRWHVLDPIRFKKDLTATVQALGWWPNGKYEPFTDDISSAGYWYQTEPYGPFPELPPVHERWSR